MTCVNDKGRWQWSGKTWILKLMHRDSDSNSSWQCLCMAAAFFSFTHRALQWQSLPFHVSWKSSLTPTMKPFKFKTQPWSDTWERVWNSFRIFFWAGLGFFFGFLGWYHLPSVCNVLELEFVILHGICHIWACSPSILHGIYYMWACSSSILWYLPHFGMFTFHFAWDFLHVGMFTFHFVIWYLPHLGMFTFHFAWDVLHVSMFTQIFTDAEAWD